MKSIADQLFVLFQQLLPTTLLSGWAHRIAQSQRPWIKNTMIQGFMRAFGITLEEAVVEDPEAFESFNAFFTRALKADARPLGDAPILSPVDGGISQLGPLHDGALIQAKGLHYSAADLLGGADLAAPFMGGQFATLYLSPKDYHRVHMPCDGRLISSHYVPGRLFAVNPPTVRALPGVFARNERLTLLFDTEHGPLAMVLVGALLVGSIETVFDGVVTPPHRGSGWSQTHDQSAVVRGQEVGRFKMGSTVIMLTGTDAPAWLPELQPEQAVRMGQDLASA